MGTAEASSLTALQDESNQRKRWALRMDKFPTDKHRKEKQFKCLQKHLNPLYRPHTLAFSEGSEMVKKIDTDQLVKKQFGISPNYQKAIVTIITIFFFPE